MKILKYKRLMVLIILMITILSALSSKFIFNTNHKTSNNFYTEHKINKKFNKTKVKATYPVYKIEPLDTSIKEFINQEIETTSNTEKVKKLQINYLTENIYDQYITIQFNKKIGKTTTNNYFTYDKKTNTFLTLKDIFRGQYQTYLKENYPNYNIDINSTSISLDNENIYLYQNETKITLPMNEVKQYIKLTNENIPSNYPHDITLLTSQEIDPNKPMIAFTFDDGPHYQNTTKVLEMFEQYNGRASFFVLGNLAKKYPEIIKNAHQRGFSIENHSYSHPNLTSISNDEVYQQIHETNDIIFSLTGRDPQYLRPPGGAYNDIVKEISNMKIQLWTIDTLDWKHRDPDKVTQSILNNVKDGSIILVHDIHSTTIEGVKNALPILYEQGYQFVTVETLHQYK